MGLHKIYMLEILHNNKAIILSTSTAWVSYMAAVAVAVMPIFQLFAFGFTIVVSCLTAVKLFREIFKKS